MMEQALQEEEEVDVTRWKDSSYAKQFRTVIRRAERRLKNVEPLDIFYRLDLEDALYELKRALIEEDLEVAEELEEEILDILED